jgi:hypothetical protein
VPLSKSSLWQFDSYGDGQPSDEMKGFGTDGNILVVLRVRCQRDRLVFVSTVSIPLSCIAIWGS